MRALDENLENPDFFGMMVAVFREASDAKLETAASELSVFLFFFFNFLILNCIKWYEFYLWLMLFNRQKEDPNYERIDRIIEDFRETSIW